MTDRTNGAAHASASAVGGIVTALTMTVAFAGLALGVDNWWIAFPVGFGALMPAAMGVAGALAADRDRGSTDAERRDRNASPGNDRPEEGTRDDEGPLDTLRERYARGEIDEVEFERRVETVLASDAEASHG